jgi:hypothetical protein
MSGKTLVIAAFGTGCLVAAGAGGYLATRTRAPIVEPDAARAPEAAVVVAAPAPDAPRPDPPRNPPPRAQNEAPEPTAAAPPESNNEREPDREPVPPIVSVVRSASQLPLARAVPRLPVPPPPEPDFLEFVIEADAVIGIRLEDPVSSNTATVEDRVMARVSRDVIVDGRTVVPAGTLLEGYVTLVERGGRFRDKAKLEVRFTALILSERERLPVLTQVITREGESPTDEAASKIGASAVIGTILGAVIGGKKGAAIGSVAGAAGGTAAVAAGNPNAATLAAGTPLTVRLAEPVTLLIKRARDE